MVSRVLRFVRLPWLLLFLFAIFRFLLGIRGVPYAPRGNAMFSVVVLTIVSALYWGALSKRVGRFGWKGTIAIGLAIGGFAQILVYLLTVISFAAHLDSSYYLNPDALNLQPGQAVTWSVILAGRTGGLVVNSIFAIVAASIGRVLGFLAPRPLVDGDAPRKRPRDDEE